MKRAACLLLASLLLAQGAALAEKRDRPRAQRQELQPRERDGFRRERGEERERSRERRFTPEERDKLRQDLLDANRDLRGRRGRR